MNIKQHTNPESFECSAGAFLLRNPLINQVLLGITESARTTPGRYPHGVRGLTVHGPSGDCIGAMIQTPPRAAMISVSDNDTARYIAAHARALYPDVPTVFGQDESARAFADAWGSIPDRITEEAGLYELTEVVPISVAAGACRVATPTDAPLLQHWMEAFSAEALPNDPPPEKNVGERLAMSERCWIWDDTNGSPVCCAQNPRRVAGFWSIGGVYTPVERRGRGYASSLVTHVSRTALGSGASGCTLFTVLANLTSNRIYQRIGYRRIGTFCKISLV
jgi:predicted GNAT family acetyltransferase